MVPITKSTLRVCSLFILALLGWQLVDSTLVYAQEGPTIILVRHAEKIDNSRDPELSESGKKRAQILARMLAESGVSEIYSTPYLRTQSTVQPLAEALSLEVQTYDPRNLEGFASELQAKEGIIVVAGHSNTTPSLASLLTGQELTRLDESDYQQFFLVSFSGDKAQLFQFQYPPFDQ
jgi:phosphohistidine phosphatase SixA